MLNSRTIPFNIPLVLGSEFDFIRDAITNKSLSGDGNYSKKCSELLEKITGSKKVIMTTSCTDALEMAAILTDISIGDEVIMASFNFVSAANAFVLRGATIRFVDIDPVTMNVDANSIEEAITTKTKVIVAMHYGGVSCDMKKIMALALSNNIIVVEDAAHCIGSYQDDKHLGSIGHLGTLSFHDTKNIQCGEGGALLINDERYLERAVILKDKGTNRSLFIKGIVQKYTWVDIGSSYSLSELNCAFLYAQLLSLKAVTDKRLKLWTTYFQSFSDLGLINTSNNQGNGHIFYIKIKDSIARGLMMNKMRNQNIYCVSHYEPLHTSKAGEKYSSFTKKDIYTTAESQKLMRFPLYFEMDENEIARIITNFTHACGM